VQRQIRQHRLDSRILEGCGFLAADLDHDAQLAAQVDVAGNGAQTLHLIADVAAGDDVFADFGDLGIDFGLGDFAQLVVRRPGGVPEQLGDKRLEVFVFGDEVCFAVDFDQDAGLGVGGDLRGDDALFGGAGGFLGGDGHAGFAQDFDGGGFVAVGFNERFFALHHADAGFFTQFLDH